MKIQMTHKLAGLVVAASLAASGGAALASEDNIQADIDGSDAGAVARAHGAAISELARETESGPGKGAIVSAAASAHGTATSEAAKSRGDHTDEEDVDTDEDTDGDEDSDTDEDSDGDEDSDTNEGSGAETATAAKADGKAFGQAKAAAAKTDRR